MTKPYQVCTRCVMDTTDKGTTFDDAGVCNYCHKFDRLLNEQWFPNEEGARKLDRLLEQIKASGVGQAYDCILGLSGGVDSSYLALKAKEWELRPLVVHVDAGWNSELAVANIEAIIKYCNYDLYTHVVDWDEMRDLQLAYFRAAIGNQDVPQDHAFFANLYRFAIKNNIRYVISGFNYATEGIMTVGGEFGPATDATNLRAVHKRFGTHKLEKYVTVGFFDYYVWYPFVKKLRAVAPLNYIPYSKKSAISELESKIGWRAYGRKHGESLFTKFFQNYYLPTKFGYDKRRLHLSSLVLSGDLSRESAIAELEKPLYMPEELESDITFFCKKLRISRDEFEQIMDAPIHHYTDFENLNSQYILLKRCQALIERVTKKQLSFRS
jgi:aminotransferase